MACTGGLGWLCGLTGCSGCEMGMYTTVQRVNTGTLEILAGLARLTPSAPLVCLSRQWMLPMRAVAVVPSSFFLAPSRSPPAATCEGPFPSELQPDRRRRLFVGCPAGTV